MVDQLYKPEAHPKFKTLGGGVTGGIYSKGARLQIGN